MVSGTLQLLQKLPQWLFNKRLWLFTTGHQPHSYSLNLHTCKHIIKTLNGTQVHIHHMWYSHGQHTSQWSPAWDKQLHTHANTYNV